MVEFQSPLMVQPIDQTFFLTIRKRGRVLIILMLLITVSLWGRILWLVLHREHYLKKFPHIPEVIPMKLEARRGSILDRDGVPLAQEESGYISLGINPKRVTDPIALAYSLSQVTNKPHDVYLQRLKRPMAFVYLERRLEPEVANRILNLPYQFIREETSRRVYPFGYRAGQLIGTTDWDNRGIVGLEYAFDSLLTGKEGKRLVQTDVKGNLYYNEEEPNFPPQNGSSLILTIDGRIQNITESVLSQFAPIFNAKSASAIVINPSTGEILAMATYPFFNPNDPSRTPIDNQRLRPITDQFEPGSVFKTITAAILLEKGWISPDSYVDCSDIRIGGKTFAGDYRESHRTFRSVLAHSINVGVIRPAQHLSPEEFYAFIRRFGFLEKTGLPFPGEAKGSLPEPSRWSFTTLATLSIGQGIAVTMTQLAAAYATVANRGIWKRPQLIKGILTPQGELIEDFKLATDRDENFRRVISPETADKLTDMLLLAVEKGTGRAARLENVAVAGKTGTAMMVNPKGGYFSDRYMVSFIGYFPLPKPQCLILVTVEDPKGPHNEHTGGDVAAPIFREIAEQILNLFPQWRYQNKSQSITTTTKMKLPDLRGSSLNSATQVILSLEGHPVKYGEGDKVIDQFPPPGFNLPSGESVLIVCASETDTKDSIVIPLFLKLSFRDALLKAHRLGITVQFSGTGYVEEQNPMPGEVASRHKICVLKGIAPYQERQLSW